MSPLVCVVLSCAVAGILLGGAGILFYLAFFRGEGAEPPPLASSEEIATNAGLPLAPFTAPSSPIGSVASSQSSPELQVLVESMEIAGIRMSDTGNRAMINGRMYGVGERIRPSGQLQLIEISARQLVFQDQHGNRYQKNF